MKNAQHGQLCTRVHALPSSAFASINQICEETRATVEQNDDNVMNGTVACRLNHYFRLNALVTTSTSSSRNRSDLEAAHLSLLKIGTSIIQADQVVLAQQRLLLNFGASVIETLYVYYRAMESPSYFGARWDLLSLNVYNSLSIVQWIISKWCYHVLRTMSSCIHFYCKRNNTTRSSRRRNLH